VTGSGLDDQMNRVWFPARAGNLLFNTMSRPALGPMQPPIQWVPGCLSLGAKWQSHEAGHSPSSSTEVKNAWSYNSTLICHHGVMLS